MIDYALLKAVHVGCAALSLAGFVLRFAWMLVDSPMLRRRATRVLPHGVDTLLLVSAVLLALHWGAQPWRDGWLPAKIIALLAYIGLGIFALRRGKDRRTRLLAGGAAILCFLYIVSVALAKSALGPFALA